MAASLKWIGRIARGNNQENQPSEERKYDKTAERYAELMRSPNRTAEQYKSAKKKLADHEWYVRNANGKRLYNKQYYENNREYWQDRYLKAKAKMGELENETFRISDEIKSSRLKGDIAGAKQMENDLYYIERQMGGLMPEERIAKENYIRAIKEEQDFINSHRSVPLADLWKLGASSVIDAGKSFISKLIGR